ncbi:MAG TPA: kelch repeat-containing protein, partial [Blastocatellia bacterium]|nr:kelch repeat-containing protein [Blastocatellia bacterium]
VHQVGRLNIERHGHTAVQLADGRILIIGGENEKETVKESEIFDSGSRNNGYSTSARRAWPKT